MLDLKRVLTLTLVVIVLAACGSQPGAGSSPTPPLTPTEGPSPTPVPTPTPEGTEDPDEGLIFDELTLIRTGGPGNTTRTITVLGNGAFLLDGALLGSVAPEIVNDLDAQLDTMGFFRLESQYGPGQIRQDTFGYTISVSRNGMEKSVMTADGYVPPSIQRLIDDLQSLTPSGPSPEPTPESGAA